MYLARFGTHPAAGGQQQPIVSVGKRLGLAEKWANATPAPKNRVGKASLGLAEVG